MKKIALITGINGQDGSYLAEFLLEKGYEVWGTIKRNSVAENQTSRLDEIYPQLLGKLQYADLTDLSSLISVIQQSKPCEIYNLAAQSHVRISFDQPIYTAQATGIGTLNLLEAIRLTDPKIKELMPDFEYTPFEQGIKETVNWFIENYDEARK